LNKTIEFLPQAREHSLSLEREFIVHSVKEAKLIIVFIQNGAMSPCQRWNAIRTVETRPFETIQSCKQELFVMTFQNEHILEQSNCATTISGERVIIVSYRAD